MGDKKGKVLADDLMDDLLKDSAHDIEIENDADQALGTLVGALNTATSTGKYDYVRTGVLGSDAIKVALAYQPAVVRPVGAYAVLDERVDPRFDTGRNRPALAQPYEPPKIAPGPCASSTRCSSVASNSVARSQLTATNGSPPRRSLGPGPRSSHPARTIG